jgi:hypothetical protein
MAFTARMAPKPATRAPKAKTLAQAAQHGPDEPDEDDGDPEHKNRGVQAQFREAKLQLVEVHALQGRGHDDEEQPDIMPAMTRNQLSWARVSARRSQWKRRSSGSARAATVTSSKKPRRAYSAYVRPVEMTPPGAAEQVTDLYNDESEEQ